MAFNYARTAATSARLLAKFGRDVTLRNYSTTTVAYDPSTGTMAPTTSDSTRKGALLDFAAGQVNGPGGLVQQGDKKLLMEPGTVPALEDRVLVGTDEYVIKGISEVNPAGTPVIYELHLRK